MSISILSDVYLVSSGIGFVYIVGTTLLGPMLGGNSSAEGDAGGDAGGDMGGDVGGDIGGDVGGDMGGDVGGDMGGDVGGDMGGDVGGDMGGDAGGDFGGDAGSDMGGEAGGDIDTHLVRMNGHFKAGLATGNKRQKRDLAMTIFKILSPSTLSTFAFFFGLTGFFLLHYFPALGFITLVPSLFIGWLGHTVLSTLTRSLTARMHVSRNFTETELVGCTAEVTVPISGGRMGEITYTVNAVRTTAPARAIANDLVFKTSSQVIITDIKDGIMYVEKCPEELLQS